MFTDKNEVINVNCYFVKTSSADNIKKSSYKLQRLDQSVGGKVFQDAEIQTRSYKKYQQIRLVRNDNVGHLQHCVKIR